MAKSPLVRCKDCGKMIVAPLAHAFPTDQGTFVYQCRECFAAEQKAALEAEKKRQKELAKQRRKEAQKQNPSWFRKNWALCVAIFCILGVIVEIPISTTGVLMYAVLAVVFGVVWFISNQQAIKENRDNLKKQSQDAALQKKQYELQQEKMALERERIQLEQQRVALEQKKLEKEVAAKGSDGLVKCPTCGGMTKNGTVCEFCGSILDI